MSLLAAQDSRIAEAERRAAAGDLRGASAVLELAVKEQPGDAAVWGRLGALRDQAGDYVSAAEAYRRSVEINPAQADIWIALGNLHYHLKDSDGAFEAYRQAVAVDGANPLAHNNLGTIFRDFWKLDSATTHFQQAARLDSTYALAVRNLGDALLRLGRNDDAATALRTATRLDPDNLYGWYWLGRAELRRGRADVAAPLFLKVLAHRKDLPQVHHDLGQAYLALHHQAEALHHFGQAVALSPVSDPPRISLARLHRDFGREEAAITLLEEGLADDSTRAALSVELGDLHKSADRIEPALEAYRRAVRGDPTNWLGHYKEGVALLYKGDEAGAERALLRAEKLAPREGAIVHFLGLVELKRSRNEAAEQHLLRSLALDSTDAEVWLHLGQARLRQQEWHDAVAALERAEWRGLVSSELFYNLSELHKKLGDSKKARGYAERFQVEKEFEEGLKEAMRNLSAGGAQPDLVKQLGSLYERHGDLEKAADRFSQAIALGDSSAGKDLERVIELRTQPKP